MYLAIKLCASLFRKGLAIVRKPRDTLGIVVDPLGAPLAVNGCDTVVCVVQFINDFTGAGVLPKGLKHKAQN
jgi:hypothetical protein